MTFEEFKDYVISDDKENCFSVETNIPCIVPTNLVAFYKSYNPIDVEISTEIGAVRFFPANKLEALQKEYQVANAFVFATCNGDPIFLSDGAIYTFPHGVKEPVWESITSEWTKCFICKP